MAKKKPKTPNFYARVDRLEFAETQVDFARAVIRDALKALAKCAQEEVKKPEAELNQMLKKLAAIEAALAKKRKKLEDLSGGPRPDPFAFK